MVAFVRGRCYRLLLLLKRRLKSWTMLVVAVIYAAAAAAERLAALTTESAIAILQLLQQRTPLPVISHQSLDYGSKVATEMLLT
jgi:hypothetical protein